MDILTVLQDKNCTMNELASLLGRSLKDVTNEIKDLEDNLIVYKNNKGKYALVSKSNYFVGTLYIVEDKGMVKCNDDYYIIENKNLLGAANEDEVLIEQIGKIGYNKAGKVKKVKKRKQTILGEVIALNNKKYIKPLYTNICVICDINDLIDGTIVELELDEKVDINIYKANIVDIVCHKADPDMDSKLIFKKHKVPVTFPKEVINEIENIPNEVREEDILGRVDLRNDKTFTIDGDDTKDYDDAISIEKVGDNYIVKVSIADVSHYIPYGSRTFNQAVRVRGTSIYPAGSVNPMLPRKLSNGICSLNPNVDRLTLTFQITFDSNANIIDFDIYESVINSKKRMTYSEVNSVLEDGIVREDYNDYVNELKELEYLYKIIRAKKCVDGYIDFDFLDKKYILDDDKNIIDIKEYPRKTSEKIIEDFMTITNELAALYGLCIYRNHDVPSSEKMARLSEFLKTKGIVFYESGNVPAKRIQELLISIKDRPDYMLIATNILRSLKKAYYDIENIGHYALCTDAVGQVTSPIRRSGDLVNHAYIKAGLKGYSLSNKMELKLFAKVASETERTAELCEREINRLKELKYMQNHIGESYEGIITLLEKSGAVVLLSNMVEGFIKYDDRSTYSVGDKVTVIVDEVNLENNSLKLKIQNEKVKKLSNIK